MFLRCEDLLNRRRPSSWEPVHREDGISTAARGARHAPRRTERIPWRAAAARPAWRINLTIFTHTQRRGEGEEKRNDWWGGRSGGFGKLPKVSKKEAPGKIAGAASTDGGSRGVGTNTTLPAHEIFRWGRFWPGTYHGAKSWGRASIERAAGTRSTPPRTVKVPGRAISLGMPRHRDNLAAWLWDDLEPSTLMNSLKVSA